ncbi:hypothetical protein QBL02_02655 [Leucobacter sp. UT-8R-CII-1-4]|uniref:hypothetical protein n=1 Tax=Leucobacter sp. UT-8R-CII-1-4 TaxID=3040075 RepID=UPI0024A7D49E|nr:hypothetical protein [Leucobacter sp. UT-8R-CII-1-4]MDI6022439.1 hypothetical protein [Leucobacter sp. UT-8R-CII-1-4]
MSHASTETIAPRKRRSRWTAALIALCLTAAGVVVYTAAANAATELTTFVSSQDGETDQVDATVLTSTSTTLMDGWYVCDSALTIDSQVTIASSSNVQIILGDSCVLEIIGSPGTGGTGILVPSSSALTIYGQENNSGRAAVTGVYSVAIGNVDAPNGAITLNGGHMWINTYAGLTGRSYPGIGTSGTNELGTPGPITIRWNASVFAMGSGGDTIRPGAPAIGTGAGSSTVPTLSAGSINIDTTGLVLAYAGAAGKYPSSPEIGTGSWIGGAGSKTINMYIITTTAIGPGSMKTQDWNGTLTNNNSWSAAAGSSMTYVTTPNSGAKLRTVDSGLNLVSTDGDSSTYRLPVTGNATKSSYFWYPTTSTVTTTPVGKQTYPGNVTISGSITQDSNIALLVDYGQAQLWINGAPAQTQTVINGKVSFNHYSPSVGTYSYQIKYMGSTVSQFLATSESAPLTGFEVSAAEPVAPSIVDISATGYTYGDAPVSLSVNGAYAIVSSDPAVASIGPFTSETGVLTINQAGSIIITITGTDGTTISTPLITVSAATPAATLTRTGGDTADTPANLTMTVKARGTGTTPQGLVQFSLKNKKLGDPLPLVDNGDGTASVSLTGIPLANTQSQSVEAVYLGETGKYATVTKTELWYLGADGYCIVETPPES